MIREMTFLGLSFALAGCGNGDDSTGSDQDAAPLTHDASVDASLQDATAPDAAEADATVPDGGAPDTGTGAEDAAAPNGDAGAPIGDSGTPDSRLLGSWFHTNGGVENTLTFLVTSSGNYGFLHNHITLSSQDDQEDDGTFTSQGGVLTFTTTASSCEPYEAKPAPYSNVYSISEDGKTLNLTTSEGDITVQWTSFQTSNDYAPGCEVDGGWVLGNVTSF